MKRIKPVKFPFHIENCPDFVGNSLAVCITNAGKGSHSDKKFVDGNLVIELLYGDFAVSYHRNTLIVHHCEPRQSPIVEYLTGSDWKDILSGRRSALNIFSDYGKKLRLVQLVYDYDGNLIPTVVLTHGDEEISVGYNGSVVAQAYRDNFGAWKLMPPAC